MMEQEKAIQEHRVSLKKKEKIIGIVIIGLMIVGVVTLAFGAFRGGVYLDLQSDDYMTDDGIAYRDLENATYTYEGSELAELSNLSGWFVASGLVLVVIGYAMFVVFGVLVPSNTKAHEMYCDGLGEKTHCPECGLKLSRLEKK